MTEKEFFEHLEKTKRENWFFTNGMNVDVIRYEDSDGTYCPITTVCKELGLGTYGVGLWHVAARKLNLKNSIAERIVLNSDNFIRGKTRKKIFDATGLQE